MQGGLDAAHPGRYHVPHRNRWVWQHALCELRCVWLVLRALACERVMPVPMHAARVCVCVPDRAHSKALLVTFDNDSDSSQAHVDAITRDIQGTFRSAPESMHA
jgi:hypothetical protein